MNCLNNEVIICIFLRLPVKTLIRCQSVCKTWQSIINRTYFIDLHHNRPSNKDQLLSYRNCQEVTLILYRKEDFITNKHFLGFPSNAYHIQPVGSVRGILCFSSERSIYFCNPSICKTKIIPNPHSNHLFHNMPNYGFGFVPRTRDFKLVRILSKSNSVNKNSSYQVDVYTLSSNLWRRVKIHIPCVIRGSESEATLDGIVHWRASYITRENVKYNFILGFDLDKEEFRQISLPESCSPDVNFGIFRSSCGNYLHMYSVVPYMTFNVWVMNEYGVSSSWTKMFTVEDTLFLITPFMFVQCDDQLVALTFGGSIIVYDRRGREVERHISVLKYHQWAMPVFSYKESLVWFDESEVVEKKVFGIKVGRCSGWLMVSVAVLAASCFLKLLPVSFF